MQKALTDVIEKKHDKVACQQNCKENGKIFNHAAFQCHYYSKSPKFDELLIKRALIGSDYPDASTDENEGDVEQLIALDDKLVILEELEFEVKLGCRAQEDVKDLEACFVDL